LTRPKREEGEKERGEFERDEMDLERGKEKGEFV
jgi:hypothetical protein